MQPGEIVHRPDPGLARGMWEAPPWLFAVVTLVAIVAIVLYVLVRAGKLRVTRARAPEQDGASPGADSSTIPRGKS